MNGIIALLKEILEHAHRYMERLVDGDLLWSTENAPQYPVMAHGA